MRRLTAGWLVLAMLVMAADAPAPSTIKEDERVVFFPALAEQGEDGTWIVPVHGWIFEPEHDGRFRRLTLKGLAKTLGRSSKAAESNIFRSRAAAFLVDNESDKRIAVKIGNNTKMLSASGSDGHFHGEVIVKSDRPHVKVTTTARDGRQFVGLVYLVGTEGVSVISDIDDTIKISHVGDKQKLLAATFTKPFEAAPGMAKFYQQLQSRGAVFHYVSSSPWQLYEPLKMFMAQADFPAGSMHMKKFRLKDSSFFDLFTDPAASKIGMIDPMIRSRPGRAFILVGDSGEKDPEVYAGLYRKYPMQVKHIYIRNVTDEDAAAARYAEVFKGMDADKWTVFDESVGVR